VLKLAITAIPFFGAAPWMCATSTSRCAIIASEMLEAMAREDGVGLAAPQVGLDLRLAGRARHARTRRRGSGSVIIVNPEIVERSHDTWVYEEGCLSIPGIRGDVTRTLTIRLRYQDLEGQGALADAEGMFARILQHEIDHLDGKLFIDYLSTAEKALIKPKLRNISKLNDE
jgi:peptide deformylase